MHIIIHVQCGLFIPVMAPFLVTPFLLVFVFTSVFEVES